MDMFRESFSQVKNALEIGDVDWVIESTNTITENFGGDAIFRNFEEFNDMMMKETTFKL